jgi:hypothetical protein
VAAITGARRRLAVGRGLMVGSGEARWLGHCLSHRQSVGGGQDGGRPTLEKDGEAAGDDEAI